MSDSQPGLFDDLSWRDALPSQPAFEPAMDDDPGVDVGEGGGGVTGAGVIGAGMIGAGMIGAGMIGAGMIGAGVIGAGELRGEEPDVRHQRGAPDDDAGAAPNAASPDLADARHLLQSVWGHPGFRAGQEELVAASLAGRDAVAVLPTGAGKSLCYQLPAVALHRRGLGPTVVVSPLIALMDDQVAALEAAGVPAAALHSAKTGTPWSHRKAQAEQAALIYVSPERLSKVSVQRWLARLGVARVVVDEAHCISSWGHDFRPAYRELTWLKPTLQAPVMAVTATAPPKVADDIVRQLELSAPVRLRLPARRANLRFSVRHCASDKERVDIAATELSRLDLPGEGRALVYVTTRKRTKSVCMALRKRGINATWYHAGRTVGARAQAAAAFESGRAPVMVATTAWGMGIDRADVRAVVHVQAPGSVAAWAQEAGRAGRDGAPAQVLLLVGASDRITRRRLVRGAPRAMAAFEDLLRLVGEPRCRQVALAEVLHGSPPPSEDRVPCGTCDVCVDAAATQADVAAHRERAHQRSSARKAQKHADHAARLDDAALAEVVRFVDHLKRPVGRRLVALGLKGSRAKDVRRKALDKNPVYGALAAHPTAAIEHGIEALLEAGKLARKGRKYPTVWIADKRVRQAATPGASRKRDVGLRGALKTLRRGEARRRRLKPYQVFDNKTLGAIEARRPTSHAELEEVPGIGPARLEKYGDLILAAVAAHPESRGEGLAEASDPQTAAHAAPTPGSNGGAEGAS